MDRRDFLLAFSATGAVTTTKVATAAEMDGLVEKGITTARSMVRLRTVVPARADAVILLRGYYAPLDGGEGIFSWNPTSTEPDNGGTVIAPAPSSPGRWERSTAGGAVNVRWFGARGDGVTDDTVAI